MTAWESVRARAFARASRGCRKASRRHGPPSPGPPEAAPFPVRPQTAADLADPPRLPAAGLHEAPGRGFPHDSGACPVDTAAGPVSG